MHHIPKRTYFALAVILTLTAVAAGQSVETKGANVDVTVMSGEAQIEHFRESRQSVADDPFRPLYHFSPPGYGLHDVGGLCSWQGKYHLLLISNHAARPKGVEIDEIELVEMGKYFKLADHLINRFKYRWMLKEINIGTEEIEENFGRDGGRMKEE